MDAVTDARVQMIGGINISMDRRLCGWLN